MQAPDRQPSKEEKLKVKINQPVKEGASIIISGASTGIGRALSLQLAKEHKARLVINARSVADLEKTARLINELGGQAVTVAGDIASPEITKKLIETCLNKFGNIDIVINNAGIAKPGTMTDLTPDDWRQVFEVNFFAALSLTYEALPYLLKQGSGKIVNIASIAGKVAFPGSVCYAASKFALTGFSEGMAAEFSHKGIDVITVCPGWIRTEFFRKNQTAGDPTTIAQGNDWRGWLMRHVLSMSSEECANEIIKALVKGGSHELVLTMPGLIVERLKGFCPRLSFLLASFVPVKAKSH